MKLQQSKFLIVAALFALAACGAQAASSVFEYNFPGSWNGTGTTVMDLSSAGNNGNISGTLSLSSSVPPGALPGTQSIVTSAGGILTASSLLLNNSLVAAAGGFKYSVSFMWDGTDSSSFAHTEKIIDYAGTESLQLTTTTGSAQLQMRFDDSVNAVSTTILPNTWYSVAMEFDTLGNAVDASGNLAGLASLTVNGGVPITAAAVKTAQGDTLNRPIGIGQLGANFGYLVGFKGDIYDPTVTLVPEPSALALLGLGAVTMLLRRKARVS
jgi:hypothetical protein